MSAGAEFDAVVYGASGFTGKQAARYLVEKGPPGLRVALAGRAARKLEDVRSSLGTRGAGAGVIVADSGDAASVDAMVARARCVVSTAGPFARYGSPVVEACARRGVDYVDITGETPWVRDMIDRHDATARASGARVVPLCGFDSIPSDLGTWMMADFARRTWGAALEEMRSAFVMGRVGLNGGTAASALLLAEQGEQRRLADPVLLSPEAFRTSEERRRNPDPRWVARDHHSGRWLAPFFMGPVNSRVVRRSHALLSAEGKGYGARFRYEERLDAGSRAKAWGMALGMAAGVALLSVRPGRALMRRLVPAPGEGPSEELMDAGFTLARYAAVTEDGRRLRGEMRCKGDPGNRATVLMLCESALALLLERDALPGRAGLLTPATAFEGVLLERLRRAGMTWEVGL